MQVSNLPPMPANHLRPASLSAQLQPTLPLVAVEAIVPNLGLPISTIQGELSRIQDIAKRHEQTTAALQYRLQQAEQCNAALQTAACQHMQQVTTLQQQLQQAEQRNAELQASMLAATEATVQELTNTIAQLTQQLEGHTEVLQDKNATIQQLTHTNTQLTHDRDSATAAVTQLKQQLEGHTQALQDRNTTIHQLTQTHTQLTHERDTSMAQVAELRAEFSTMQAAHAQELAGVQADNERLRQENTQLSELRERAQGFFSFFSGLGGGQAGGGAR